MKAAVVLLMVVVGLKVVPTEACMATGGNGGGGDVPITTTTAAVTTTTTAATTTTTTACALAATNSELFVGTGVNFLDQVYGMQTPVGNCDTCATGSQNFYTPAQSATPHATEPLEAIGSLNMAQCADMCVCTTDGTCYTRNSDNTVITFWPFCTGGTCSVYGFLTGVADSDGISPVGGGTPFTSGAQIDPVTFDTKPVTDPSYPQIASVSCSGCPITTCA